MAEADVTAIHRSGVRVADEDRRRVAERLATAQAEGRLELGEYDERVRAAYAAVVHADLDPLTADLPVAVATERATSTDPRRRSGGAGAVGVWAVVSAINLAVWAVVSLAAGEVAYPWWIWVAGPWGVMLMLGLLTGRAGSPAGPWSAFGGPCGRNRAT